MEKTTSPKWTLIKEDLKKLWIGALIAIGWALATYLQETIPNINFGDYTPIVVVVNSVLVNFIRKIITTNIYIK